MLASAVATLSASTINGVGSSTGTTSTVTFDAYNAGSGNMAGLIIQVAWYDGTTASCTWVNATDGCNGTNFRIRENDGSNGTFDGTWSFWNTRTGSGSSSIQTITLIGTGVGNSTGVVGFDLCWNNNGTPNYTNSGGSSICGVEGTLDSNIGWSAGTLSSNGRNIAATSVAYTNALIRLGSGSAVGDEFGKVTLSFASGVFTGTNTNSSNAFNWRMDTDIVSPVGVPEPATYGLVGLSLLGIGVLRHRKRSS